MADSIELAIWPWNTYLSTMDFLLITPALFPNSPFFRITEKPSILTIKSAALGQFANNLPHSMISYWAQGQA